MKRTICLVIAAISVIACLALVGCQSPEKAFVGEWEATAMTYNGKTTSVDSTSKFILTLNEDHTGKLASGSDSESCKWQLNSDGTSGTITVDSDTGTIALKDNVLTVVDPAGISMDFKKK